MRVHSTFGNTDEGAIVAMALAKSGGLTWRGEKPGRSDAQQGFSRPPGTIFLAGRPGRWAP